MALSTTTNKQTFTATAGDTQFAFSIPFFDAVTIEGKKYGDIKLTRQDVAGNLTQFTPKESFTNPDVVDGEFKITPTNNDPSQGGTVTISKAAAGGETFVVERDVEYTQQYDLQEGATIDPTALNKALDRAVAQNQQQNDLFTRTVEFPITDNPSRTYTVGSETERANKALGFDASGNVTEITLSDVPSSGGGGGTSTPLAADTNAGLVITNNIISAKVDNSTIQFSGGNIAVNKIDTVNLRDDAVTQAKIDDDAVTNAAIANNAVQTPQIQDNAVTHAKYQDIDNNRVIGNLSGTSASPNGVEVDLDLSVVQNHTTLATAKAIKDYVDSFKPNVSYAVKTDRQAITNTTERQEYIISNLAPSLTARKAGSIFKIYSNINVASSNQAFATGFRVQYSINSGSYTNIQLGDTYNSHSRYTFAYFDSDSNTDSANVCAVNFVSPTYNVGDTIAFRIKIIPAQAATTLYINRQEHENSTNADYYTTSSTLMVEEVYQ